MTHTENVDAAIERAKQHMTRGDQRIGTLWEDRALLAEEVVRLRQVVEDMVDGHQREVDGYQQEIERLNELNIGLMTNIREYEEGSNQP